MSFKKGDRVVLTPEGKKHLNARKCKSYGFVSTNPQTGNPNISVLVDGNKTPTYYSKGLWEKYKRKEKENEQ